MIAPDHTTVFARLLVLCTTPCPIHSEQYRWLCSSGRGGRPSAIFPGTCACPVGPAGRVSTTVVRCTCIRSGQRCAPCSLRTASGRNGIRPELATDSLDVFDPDTDVESERKDVAGGRYSANGASVSSSARSETWKGIGSCALHTCDAGRYTYAGGVDPSQHCIPAWRRRGADAGVRAGMRKN